MSEKKRYFTDEELQKMGKSPETQALELARSGDVDKAVEGVNLAIKYFKSAHDMYSDWVTSLLSYIYKKCGSDAAEEAMTEIVRGYYTRRLETWDDLSFREKVIACSTSLWIHNANVSYEEDDEKVTYYMDHCGGGQRQVEQGSYDGENCKFCRTAAASCTWSMPDFPIYCIHAPIQDKLSIQKLGYPIFVYDIPKDGVCTKPCRISIYKDPADIPEEAFTRVGYEKPDSLKKEKK